MNVYRYSRWDGTQQIMPFDADAIMEAISEDVLAHGDVQRALEKLMQQGYKFQSGERMPGLRDLLERLKQQRGETLRRNNMDAVVKDIQERLEKIKETERTGIDRRVDEGKQELEGAAQRRTKDEGRRTKEANKANKASRASSPPARISHPESSARCSRRCWRTWPQKRKEQLDELPGDIGGQIKGLKEYDFMDPDARQQFQELLAMLQQQMVQNTFSGLQQGMQNMQQDPAAMQATREMLQDLNQMLRDREEGREPKFEEFMQKHGHFFPPGIENLDQLMEHIQAQMQRMENMLEFDVAPAARPAREHDGPTDAGLGAALRDAGVGRAPGQPHAHAGPGPAVPLLRRSRRIDDHVGGDADHRAARRA